MYACMYVCIYLYVVLYVFVTCAQVEGLPPTPQFGCDHRQCIEGAQGQRLWLGQAQVHALNGKAEVRTGGKGTNGNE